ncbi:AMP-binding protein [Xenorhabdus sp. DI]|uniref:AMP-binding protein n=1 Tax=Xenorhabdus doucetiae TaxID=351671 RepID=UPI0019B9F8A1|nr:MULTISPECIES: AMP-binding protein [unclassified Xenorhabdus]MBD2784081.1 AMP-binding protein [Xenorhabdus sp. 3]MBD2787794.1 AMP-binding protein [Xenorhabdus sp. DI]
MLLNQPTQNKISNAVLPYSTGALIERCGLIYSQKIAVIFHDCKITYREQIAYIRQSGRALLRLGMNKGDRVALLIADSPELLNIYFGALWAGLVVVPLFPKGSSTDHDFIIKDSDSRAVIHDGRISDADAEFVLCVENFIYLANQQSSESGMPNVSPMDLYGIFYTGGMDGRLKGTLHTHGSYLSAIVGQMIDIGFGEQERFAHVAPITHVGGMFILPIWMKGGTNVLLGRFDPELLIHTITIKKITASMMVPTMMYILMDYLRNSRKQLSSLSNIIYGVSPFRQEQLLQALDIFGPIFTQFYGMVEAPNQITVLNRSDHQQALKTGNIARLTSLGKPVTLADINLVDDSGQNASSGEIIIRGPHITQGYWNRPEETTNSLRDGWLYTGDIATIDEQGFLYLVKRKKEIIISGGYHVYIKHVENMLLQHPFVDNVAVFGVPDDKWGELVKAVVVLRQQDTISAIELINWSKERLGSVFTPKIIEIVDFIPIIKNNK